MPSSLTPLFTRWVLSSGARAAADIAAEWGGGAAAKPFVFAAVMLHEAGHCLDIPNMGMPS